MEMIQLSAICKEAQSMEGIYHDPRNFDKILELMRDALPGMSKIEPVFEMSEGFHLNRRSRRNWVRSE